MKQLSTKQVAKGTHQVLEGDQVIGSLTRIFAWGDEGAGFEFRPAARQCQKVWTFQVPRGRGMTVSEALGNVRALVTEINEGERYPFELGGGVIDMTPVVDDCGYAECAQCGASS